MNQVAQGVADLSLLSPAGTSTDDPEIVSEVEVESDVGDETDQFKDDPLPYGGQIPLTKEHKSALFEILKCAVCLEIPKSRKNLRVKTCEHGHHFCQSCHNKLTNCAICRGKLYAGRNFVVEELINKLGKPFGIQRQIPQKASIPVQSPRGSYQCPHCTEITKLPAKHMLKHIRTTHQNQLSDNLRTNPYTGWFYFNLTTPFESGQRRSLTFQVSDLGLITLIIMFPSEDADQPKQIRAWIQLLGRLVPNEINYRLNIIADHLTSGFVDLPILPFNTEPDSVPMMPSHFTNVKDIDVSFMVFRINDCVAPPPSWPFFSFETSVHPNDRRSRRSSARNHRRNRLRRLKAAQSQKPEPEPENLEGQCMCDVPVRRRSKKPPTL